MSSEDDDKAELDKIVAEGSEALRRDLAEIMANQPVEETGWLIELKPSVSRRPQWFHLEEQWVTDASKAIRFARKQDAEAFIEYSGWTEAFASEHMWTS